MGVVEIKEALRAEVVGMCRTYCIQVWNETLNQVGVGASSALRRAKNFYYPPTIHTLSSLDPKVDLVSKKVDDDKDSFAEVLPSTNSPPKEVEQAKAVKKEKDITKGAVPEATKPLVAPKDPSKGKEAS